MKTFFIRCGTLVMWIVIAVACAVVYGVVNDQITSTISPEYYTVYKHRQFAPQLEMFGLMDAPMRVQAVLIGTLATWWYGLFLGVMLGISSMVGRYAPLSTGRFVRILGMVMASTFYVSLIFGVAAYLIEPFSRPDETTMSFLAGIRDVRSAYVVVNWHKWSYLGALLATVIASFQAQKLRRSLARAADSGKIAGDR